MNRIPLIFAALVPLVATAGGAGDKNKQAGVDKEKLRDAVPVTAVLGEEVRGNDGSELGEVDEIVISHDGKIQHVLIERDDAGLAGGGEQGAQDERVAGREDDRAWEDTTGAGGMDDDTMQVQPQDIRFNAKEGGVTVSLEGDTGQMQGGAASATGTTSGTGTGDTGQLRASEIVGMEVHLSDEESFGSVEDVMIGGDGKEVVAIVVDNWNGVNKERRAFPFEGAQFNDEEEDITYNLSSQDVEQMSEFNLDRYENEGWFNTET